MSWTPLYTYKYK